ncbi:hypothetical protein LTR91_026474 [Friedmanniomyces endolithicus]|uniref:Uncharacterized protein n=1 Tax=Friedmanniomyces endolithicus TaxID=329885 RepID=A0AAN6J1C0_9PEZI|nr:hypothetical protein LTR35_001360 [Friedmanniomyces endolithicus]KAK0297846.1 hypothetical protein LTS00_003384 [Friedmanniomyces endolithicus]KAK0305677.1 hypothetical protein LTR82_016685 [Friedmanniomyces endolithicus]KAK0921425.1 hypothetical protein LTR57_008667 [Friedmanniomyces endolithicus]KAK0949420.1 hypothetical protein LTR91_026474 [Friedmanniomyces endolithicus]
MMYAIGIIAGLIYALFQMALILPLFGILLVLLTDTNPHHPLSSQPSSAQRGRKASDARDERDDDDDHRSSCPSACPSMRGLHSTLSARDSNRDTINGMRNTNIVCVHGGKVDSGPRKPKSPGHGGLPMPLGVPVGDGNNGAYDYINHANNNPVPPLPYNKPLAPLPYNNPVPPLPYQNPASPSPYNNPASPLPYNDAPMSVSPANSDRCFSVQNHRAEQDHLNYEDVETKINNHYTAQADYHARRF